MCSVSESCFRRLFYEYKGKQPIEFKNSLRIRKANELLMTGKYTVTEVSSMINCGDLKYFNKLFKRYMGCTPSKVLQELYS
jgi:AraC-like DNA-binding protein